MAQQDYSVSGNLRVTGSTTVFGQVAIGSASLNLATFASDMIGNVNAANAAIVSANSSMKDYVDAGLISAVISASSYGNAVVAAYLPIDPSVVNINSAIASANSNINAINSNVAAANLNIASIQSNITAANANISATYSNVRALQSNVAYLTANVRSNGAVLTTAVFAGEGNLQIGNINASGNLVMTGTDATTIQFVRSPDTNPVNGSLYGVIDFAGEDISAGSAGVRARISATALDVWGRSQINMFTTGNGSTTLSSTLKANTEGVFVSSIGTKEIRHSTLLIVPPYGQVFDWTPAMNDGTSANIVNLAVGSLTNEHTPYFYDFTISHRFQQWYSGFAGGDRANISLTGIVTTGPDESPLNGFYTPLVSSDTQQSDVEFHVQGVYVENPDINPPVVKRLRKRWIATISYASSTGNWTVLDQVLQEAVYNSDAANWPAGAVNAGKAFLQANVTAGSQDLVLRLDAPNSPAVTSRIWWQITTRIRTVEYWL